MNRHHQSKTTTPLFVSVVLVCFGLWPAAKAVSPAPDGGYAGANTAEGTGALFSLTTGTNNTALGAGALLSLTSGNQNTATGAQALYKNTADGNTADGFRALAKNTTGTFNTAVGSGALFINTVGSFNTASGYQALLSNTSDNNTAIGYQALFKNTFSGFNTAVGFGALFNNTGGHNIALGNDAGANLTKGNNNIDIGNSGVPGEGNTIRIGDISTQGTTYIAGIHGQPATGGDAVFITTDGKLGTFTAVSSARFKEEIKPMNNASEVILSLKPVTFRYKKELDPKGTPQFGLVAEEVEKVDPDLVKRDRDGNLQTVRYEAVNAMLLNEFLKARRQIDAQQKQIDALTAGLEKVNNQLELSKLVPGTVANNER